MRFTHTSPAVYRTDTAAGVSLLSPPGLPTYMAKNEEVCPPTLSPDFHIQYSVFRIRARSLREEVYRVFPDTRPPMKAEQHSLEIFIIPTFQKTEHDLVAVGEGPAEEKDRLLGNFFAWGKLVARMIRDQGYWADLSDPSSGNPVLGRRGGSSLSDLDVLQQLLAYPLHSTGGCHVISHPQWGTAVYPALLFSSAPLQVLLDALKAAHQVPHSKAGHCPCGAAH